MLRSPLRSALRSAFGFDVIQAVTDVLADALSYFSADGGPLPWYAGATNYSAFYDNSTDKTYILYQNHDTVSAKRLTKIQTYDHSTGAWSQSYGLGPEGSVDADSHGVPAGCINADGRVVAAYGNHDGSYHLSVQTNVDDDQQWTVDTSALNGLYTYPHLVLQGTTVYCFFRKNVAPGAEYAAGAKTLIYRPITFSGATATVGTEVEVANFGNNSRWYQGPAFLDNGLIWQVACRADYGDNFRRDVYLYAVDIANQRLQAWDGTTVAFPVGLTDMNTTFRLHTTAVGSNVQVPSLAIDGDGRWHIAFPEGVADSDDVPIYHMYATSPAAWSSPAQIGTSVVSRDQDAVRMIPTTGGAMDAYWPNDPKVTETFATGGNIYRRTLPSGSTTWGDETLIAEFDVTRWPYNQVTPVFNAHADIRVLWSEVATTESDAEVIPPKRLFAYGDSGVVTKPHPTVADPVAFAGQGFWLDPSDLSTLFSDTAGTTPATVDGPVGLMVDKSGNGNDAVAQGSEFPVLRTDGEVYWLDFGDEFSATSQMLVSSFALVSSNAFWVTIAGRVWMETDGTVEFLAADRGTTNGTRVARLVRGTNGEVATLAFNASGTGTTVNADSLYLFYGTDDQQSLHCDGTAATAYKNGVEVGTATISGGTYDTSCTVRLGCGVSASEVAQNFVRGRIYGSIWRAGSVDLTTRNADMAWLTSKLPR